MLVELLYPKELKEVIKKLRVENDLNETAIREINKSVRAPLLFFLLVIVPILCLKAMPWCYFGGAFTLMILLCFASVRRAAFDFALPYTVGEIVQSKIDRVDNRQEEFLGSPSIKVFYSYEVNGNLIQKQAALVHLAHEIKAGDEIGTFYMKDKIKNSALCIPEYFQKLCLSTYKIKNLNRRY